MKLTKGKPDKVGAYFTRCVKNGAHYYAIQCLICEDHLSESSWTEYKYITHYIGLEEVENQIHEAGE